MRNNAVHNRLNQIVTINHNFLTAKQHLESTCSINVEQDVENLFIITINFRSLLTLRKLLLKEVRNNGMYFIKLRAFYIFKM